MGKDDITPKNCKKKLIKNLNEYSVCHNIFFKKLYSWVIREAAKKVLYLVGRPLRGGGRVSPAHQKKKLFCGQNVDKGHTEWENKQKKHQT